MKKFIPFVLAFSLVKLAIHLVGNRNYGFHRDELLHLSVSEHPAWGYMEFPPFISWIGTLSHFIFGYSVSGTRIFATAAGIAILVICCKMAKELGGGIHSVVLSGVAFLSFLPFYRNHMLFQPVAFDQLFWTLGFWFLLRYINTEKPKYLVYLGIAAGFGLLNKYTFLVWGLGIAAGLLFYKKGQLFREKWIYVSSGIALLMFLPNIIWQASYDFPVVKHLEKLKESQLDEIGPYDFVLDQVEFLFTFILSLIGLGALLFWRSFKNHRNFGVSVIVIFATMWAMQSKAYYFFAIYPILFASGAVFIEKISDQRKIAVYVVAVLLIVPVFFYLPKAIPVLSIESHIAYEEILPDENGHYKLSDDYADTFGWDEQVKIVDSLYKSLSPEDRKQCVILPMNYGEAGAVKILGDRYGLPDPVSFHGSFWIWGPRGANGKIAITIGHTEETVKILFEDYKLVKTLTHPYAIEEENNIPVYLCRNAKIDFQQIWPSLETRIFD